VDLAAGLVARNVEVSIAYSPVRADTAFLEGIENIQPIRGLHRVAMSRQPGPEDLLAWWRLRKLVREHGPFDLIHGQSTKAGALARLVGASMKIPVVYTPHALITMNPELGSAVSFAYRKIEVFLSHLCSKVIGVSADEREHAIQLGIDASKLVVIHNGLRKLPIPDRDGARAFLGTGDDVCIGIVGRLSHQKNVARLVEAFAKASSQVPHARLVIVGDGPERKDIKQTVEQRGLTDKVVMTGHQDGPTLMAGFDIFAMSSRYEGLPYVLLEAAARNLPIVAADTGDTSDLVLDGVNGFVITDGGINEMSDRLIQLAKSKTLRQKMGQASGDLAAEFTVENMVEQTLAVYEEVAGVQ
jgi:glycosyltransferase involved in cell wall biosynthesis